MVESAWFKFACSPRAGEGSLRVLRPSPTCKGMHVMLIGESKQ